MKFFSRKDTPVKSIVLTIIPHLGPTHLQRVSASLGETLWQTGPPYLPILTDKTCNAHVHAFQKEEVPLGIGIC